jgi:hypothetical protein
MIYYPINRIIAYFLYFILIVNLIIFLFLISVIADLFSFFLKLNEYFQNDLYKTFIFHLIN